MYQSIYYVRDKNHPKAWTYYLRDDKAGIKNFKYYPTVYKLDEEGEFETLFGDRCSAVTGRYDKTDPNILEKDIPKELALLRDLYYETDEMPSFHSNVFLDIEIEIIGPLNSTTIKEANAPITSISMMDEEEKICFILDTDNELEKVVEDGITIHPCKTELELLKNFLSKWEQMDPTNVIHYNGDFFDIPYLYYRIKKKLGTEVNRLSPVGIVHEDPYKPDSPITIALVNSLDYMHLFKKYISKEEPSYKLGDIGQKYVNLGKIEYNGSLDKLYKEDKKKFIQYNIRDIEIIKALEDKQQFIQSSITICHLCKCPYNSIYYNSILNEGAILTYLKRRNIVAPNKPTTTNPTINELEKGDLIVNQRGTPTIEGIVHDIRDNYIIILTSSGKFISRNIRTVKKKEGFAGGFLLEPKPGLYSWLSDFDYSSYYPNCIRSLNIGIETLVGKISLENYTKEIWWGLEDLKEKDPNQEIDLDILNTKNFEFFKIKYTIGKLIKKIEKNNLSISSNGVIFDNNKPSIVSLVLKDWFNMRKNMKKQMEEAYKRGDDEKGKLYDGKQYSLKILLNAVYGGFAINSFRFTDGYKIISSAITCTCQRMIQETIKYANEIIDKKYFS